MIFISQIFLMILIMVLQSAILKKKYLWLLPFFMAVTSYYANMRRTMRTAIVSYFLKLVCRYFSLVTLFSIFVSVTFFLYTFLYVSQPMKPHYPFLKTIIC